VRRLVPLIALTATVLTTTAPAPAGAADVGRQVERSAPAKYPENIPGCAPRCVRGRTITRGWVLLSRRVRLDAGERRTAVRFSCPGRRRFRTFGFLESGDLLVQIPDSQLPYTGRRRVRASAERILAPVRRPAAGTLYAVCVPR
jgi:hypothetical protein